jgi:hypothetical protein
MVPVPLGMVLVGGVNVTIRKPGPDYVDATLVKQDPEYWESVVDEIDRMRNDGGVSPELPHEADTARHDHGSLKLKDV